MRMAFAITCIYCVLIRSTELTADSGYGLLHISVNIKCKTFQIFCECFTIRVPKYAFSDSFSNVPIITSSDSFQKARTLSSLTHHVFAIILANGIFLELYSGNYVSEILGDSHLHKIGFLCCCIR